MLASRACSSQTPTIAELVIDQSKIRGAAREQKHFRCCYTNFLGLKDIMHVCNCKSHNEYKRKKKQLGQDLPNASCEEIDSK